jgi:WD40-like Beta Propeller Repeat
MLKAGRLYNIIIALSLALAACQSAGTVASQKEREYTAFDAPERVTIRGYGDHAMEPFITRDGRYLFFNNSNDPSVNTNLRFAERINDLTFEYKGEVAGVNTQALEGVPTLDKNGVFYFVSSRSYKEDLSTIYRGRFSGGAVTGVKIVEGISEKTPGRVNFDVEVSEDGQTLYFVDGVFSGRPTPDKADIAIAVRDGEGFRRLSGSAELLKNVNTDALEYAACISPDELELFFTRAGKNGPAIYRSTRKSVTHPFDPPVRVDAIKGFVEAPALSPDGRSLYYHLREGARFVIYRAARSL